MAADEEGQVTMQVIDRFPQAGAPRGAPLSSPSDLGVTVCRCRREEKER